MLVDNLRLKFIKEVFDRNYQHFLHKYTDQDDERKFDVSRLTKCQVLFYVSITLLACHHNHNCLKTRSNRRSFEVFVDEKGKGEVFCSLDLGEGKKTKIYKLI